MMMYPTDDPPAEPRPAAAIIMIDTYNPRKVLLAKRSEALAFMGGQFCFPGGRIHQDEGRAHVMHEDDPERAVALHAAVREVFEETGLLCVEGVLPAEEQLHEARGAAIDSPPSFDHFLAAHGLWIDGRRFEDAGLWVTPPISPIRFRTRYFLHRYRGTKIESVHDCEIVELHWVEPSEARRRWRAGIWDTSTPVGFALARLAMKPEKQWASTLKRVPNTPNGVPGCFELRWGIHLVPLRTATLPPATHTNCVIVGEAERVVIDPGAADPTEQAMLLGQLEALDAGSSHLRAVLLTHSHHDHVAAAEWLRQRLGCPIWADARTGAQAGIRLDRALMDGDTVELAGDPPWRLRCIHTPGHDPGHMCYLEESTGMLIAGDMVANPGSIYIAPHLGGDMSAYLRSLEHLKSLNINRIVPGHGIPLQSGARDLVQRHIDHRLGREAKIRHALSAGIKEFSALLRHVYADVPESALALASGNLRAHLMRLGAEVCEVEP